MKAGETDELRPLTIEQVCKADVVWLQDIDKPHVIAAIPIAGTPRSFILMTTKESARLLVDSQDYMRRWCAWGQKPDRHEMEAVQWGK